MCCAQCKAQNLAMARAAAAAALGRLLLVDQNIREEENRMDRGGAQDHGSRRLGTQHHKEGFVVVVAVAVGSSTIRARPEQSLGGNLSRPHQHRDASSAERIFATVPKIVPPQDVLYLARFFNLTLAFGYEKHHRETIRHGDEDAGDLTAGDEEVCCWTLEMQFPIPNRISESPPENFDDC